MIALRCRIAAPAAAVIGCALAIWWMRSRRRAPKHASGSPSCDEQTNSSTERVCPYANAELRAIHLPIEVNVETLPCGVSLAPVLSYPPRHAMIPLVLQDGLTSGLTVSQALLCCEDTTTCASNGQHRLFPAHPVAGDADAAQAKTRAFREYVSSACPYLRGAVDANVVCAEITAPNYDQSSVFTHVAVSNNFCAYLGFLPEAATVVSLVLVRAGAPNDAVCDLQSVMQSTLSSNVWNAVAQSVTKAQQAKETSVVTAFGKGRLRAATKSLRTGRVVSAGICPCPNVAAMFVELDEVIETDTPMFVAEDGVDGVVHRVPMYEGSTSRDQNDGSTIETTDNGGKSAGGGVSSSLEASALEAWGDGLQAAGDSVPLLLYTNDIVGVSFACNIGSSVQEVRFACRPTVRYVPLHADAAALGSPTVSLPLLTVERLRTLPECWEQATPSFTPQDFLELLHHNIVYCLTPWETLHKRPDITPVELTGMQAWMFHEEQDGQRCRTFVCPKLESLGPSTRKGGHHGLEQPSGPFKVVELLLVRWEVAVEHWEEYLPLLRTFVDRMHIDFDAALC